MMINKVNLYPNQYSYSFTGYARVRNSLYKDTFELSSAANKILSGKNPSFGIGNTGLKQTLYYQKHGIIHKHTKLADGFMDGGKGAHISSNADIESKREIIVVDRTKDQVLQSMIDEVKTKTKDMSETDKIKELFSYMVNKSKHTYSKNYSNKAILNANKKVLVGDCINDPYHEARHASIVFKIIADEIGIKSDLVKGTFLGKIHAWNVVYQKGKRPYIYDVAQGLIEDYKHTRLYVRAK